MPPDSIMKHVKKSVLLWYSPREMYSPVTGIPDHPSSCPGATAPRWIEQHDAGMTARCLGTTPACAMPSRRATTHVSDASVEVDLVDGPFSLLEGTWRFVPLAMPGDDEPEACRIEFDLRYAFSSKALEAVVSPVFDRVANTFVDSFVRRAEDVYGARPERLHVRWPTARVPARSTRWNWICLPARRSSRRSAQRPDRAAPGLDIAAARIGWGRVQPASHPCATGTAWKSTAAAGRSEGGAAAALPQERQQGEVAGWG